MDCQNNKFVLSFIYVSFKPHIRIHVSCGQQQLNKFLRRLLFFFWVSIYIFVCVVHLHILKIKTTVLWGSAGRQTDMDLRISKLRSEGCSLQPLDRPGRGAGACLRDLHRPHTEAQGPDRSHDHLPPLLLGPPGWLYPGPGLHLPRHALPRQHPGAQQPVHGLLQMRQHQVKFGWSVKNLNQTSKEDW